MFAFWTPGPTEIIIILVMALLLFAKRLPEVGRSLGRGIVEFKKGVKGIEDEIEDTISDDVSRPPTPRGNQPAGGAYRPVEQADTPDPEREKKR